MQDVKRDLADEALRIEREAAGQERSLMQLNAQLEAARRDSALSLGERPLLRPGEGLERV